MLIIILFSVLLIDINILVYFFFQAEDGIRDHCVTGVQTCALPISRVAPAWRDAHTDYWQNSVDATLAQRAWSAQQGRRYKFRSEERRVGKECSYRCAPHM